MRSWASCGVLVFASVVHAVPASAQDVQVAQEDHCPSPLQADPSLATHSSVERLGFIQTRLRDDARHARTWTVGWTLGFAALTVGGAAAAGIFQATGSPDEAFDQAVGAGASLVGVVFTLINQRPVTHDQRALDARIATSTGTPTDTCAVLADAEAMLVRDARAETDGHQWYLHALGIGFNLGVAALLGFGYGHWRNAVTDLVVGTALSEAQAWTQPSGAIDGLARYRAGDLTPAVRGPVAWSFHPILGVRALGVAVGGAF